MVLALFDLDETLIAGDSEDLWTKHLVQLGVRPKKDLEIVADFYQDYGNGCLNFQAYQKFFLQPLCNKQHEKLEKLLDEFVQQTIKPIIRQSLINRINWHREQDDIITIITAAGSFVAEPIAKMLNIKHLLCTQQERINGQYTGNILQPACFQNGKIKVLEKWCHANNYSMEKSWMYSDSHNDLPLMEFSEFPVAVVPDSKLRSIANERQWLIIEKNE